MGLSAAATALRIETEDLITALNVRRPELVAKSDERSFLEAAHYASVARQLRNYHAASARESSDRIVRLLGIRDAMMADNLASLLSRQRGRGKVLAFAHKGHGLPTSAIAALPTRSGSTMNSTYFALTPQSFTDFDWLAVLNATAYNRGGPPLQQSDADPKQ